MHNIKKINIKLILIISLANLIYLNCSRSLNKNFKTENIKWDLIWHDEFETQFIETLKWEHEVNAWGCGNNELQYYTARTTNSYIENGFLVIQTMKENYIGPEGSREYTSARLRTLNRGDWKYGKIEVKDKLPRGQGIWPAIWMLPSHQIYGTWAASGEIDIMELVGHEPNKVYGTLHYGDRWPNNVHSGDSYKLDNNNFSDDFHIFGFECEANDIRWYVDGYHYQTQTTWFTKAAEFPAPFNQPFHLVLNVAVGENWHGSSDSTTIFPQRMYIDYVRVYK